MARRSERLRMKLDQERRFISHDIVLKILLLVPPRYLLNLKLVCKLWRSTITDPAFFAAYTQHTSPSLVFMPRIPPNEKRRALYFYHYRSNVSKKVFLDKHLRNVADINFLSSDGLLLLYSQYLVHVFNPFTEEIVKLPNLPSPDYISVFGFSVNCSTGKYNVVRLMTRCRVINRCDIFIQGSQCWREKANGPCHVTLEDESSVSIKGVVYWRTFSSYVLSCNLDRDGNARFKDIPPPYDISNSFSCHTRIENLEGSLCIVVCRPSKVVDIWMLKEENRHGLNEWNKWYSIKDPIPKLPHLGLLRILAVEEGKLWLATVTELFCYDTKSEGAVNKLTEIKNLTNLPKTGYTRGALYIESWASAR